MRFRPRRILIYLLVAVTVVIFFAHFLSYSDNPLKSDGYLIYEGPLPDQPIQQHVPFEERFKKYEKEGGEVTQTPISNLRLFRTREIPGISTTPIVVVTPSVLIKTEKVQPPRNWSDNEWYREQFVRSVWKNSYGGGSSIWVANLEQKQGILDDRILKQMSFVPKRYQVRKSSNSKGVVTEIPPAIKTIYVPGGVDTQTPLGTLMFLKEECPVSACNLTTDIIHEKTAHLRLLQGDAYFSSFDEKPPGQIWAIWILESPANTVDFNGPENLINWTATYRWDSTIVTPYAKFVPFKSDVAKTKQRGQEFSGRNYAANKTKMVAWFVSNCNAKNRRWEVAQELGKYIPVDIFGGCGTLECPRSEQNQCNDLLNSDYKFYLSFENSNCDHYITEKFFENGLTNDVIPIVMGARKEDYSKSAPPKSYIHVDDFPSVKDLADYLLQLNSSDSLYNEYFRWKGTGEFINTKFWCRLCALLHDDEDDQRPEMWYTDFHKWWQHDAACNSEPEQDLIINSSNNNLFNV